MDTQDAKTLLQAKVDKLEEDVRRYKRIIWELDELEPNSKSHRLEQLFNLDDDESNAFKPLANPKLMIMPSSDLAAKVTEAPKEIIVKVKSPKAKKVKSTHRRASKQEIEALVIEFLSKHPEKCYKAEALYEIVTKHVYYCEGSFYVVLSDLVKGDWIIRVLRGWYKISDAVKGV